MKKLYYLIPLALIIIVKAHGQGESTASPQAKSFSLSGDNLGAIANSVNLFTGDLNLPLSLVSIPGQGGLGMDVSIVYSSANIENQVDIWNLEAPAGPVGLGWSLNYPTIVVDNKLTGARDDDEFYLVEGGASNRLICTANNSGVKSYKTKIYTNWIITFTSSTEKWEIVKDDGMKFIYGDKYSGRNTVQWMVKWNNWIGNSHATSSQRQGLIWNLSEVQNTWGQKITYTYLNDENLVGGGSVNHTEASYLQKINDSWGHEVELVYRNKLPGEYMDPHTEVNEPDAYQERYEKRYLDKIIVKSDGVPYLETQLKYVTNLLGSGNLTKRLLKNIVQVSANGSTQASSITFDYLTSGNMKGALSTVSTALGGSVTFEYHSGLAISNSTRNKTDVNAPAGYKEPTVTVEGDDYVVVTWRQLSGTSHTDSERPVVVSACTWDGKWRERSLGSIGNVKMTQNKQDFLIVTKKDFFAILKPTYSSTNYVLYIWHRDETKSGEWISHSFNIDLGPHDTDKEQLFAGDNFVAVSSNMGKLFRYVWNGSAWTASTISIPSPRIHFTTAGGNYIISHNTGRYLINDYLNPDEITFYYLDELKNWQTKNITSTFNNGTGDSQWAGANSFALVMANTNGNEYAYKWDEYYNTFTRMDLGFHYPDNSTVMVTGESQITLIQPSTYSDFKIKALRYDGSAWHDSGDQIWYNSANCSAGSDLFLWENDGSASAGKTYVKEFDPNTLTWKSSVLYTGSNIANQAEAGVNQVWIYSKLYQRSTDGSWSQIGTLGGSDPGGDWDLKPIFNAFPFSNVYFVKNGQWGTYSESYSGYYGVTNSYYNWDRAKYLLGPKTFVTGPSSRDFLNASSVNLYHINNYKITGAISDYPVTKVILNDGANTFTTLYDYDGSTAVFDQSGITAQYNKVTTIQGTASLASRPFGYTETYFFNGLSSDELGSSFPEESAGNASSYFKIFTGQVYNVKIKNQSNQTVAQTITSWEGGHFDLSNGTSSVDYTFFLRPSKVTSIKDGITTNTGYVYNAKNQIQLQSTSIEESVTQPQQMIYSYIYGWERYSNLLAKNILSPVVQATKLPDFSSYGIESAVTRWKEWPCSGSNCPSATIPAPADKYLWRGAGAPGFSWWDVSSQTPPSTSWIFSGGVTTRDVTSGIDLETVGRGDQITSRLVDQNKRATIASIANAPLAKIAYTSFEDASTGNWSWSDGIIQTGDSKTGNRFMSLGTTGLTKSGLTTSDNYTLSFWAKSNGGNVIISGVGTINLGNASEWTLFEYPVSGVASLNIKRSGTTEVQLDEIRTHPTTAGMTTSTYHPMFGVTSANSLNNQVSYIEYDDVGRIKSSLDENRNIVKAYQYNFKK